MSVEILNAIRAVKQVTNLDEKVKKSNELTVLISKETNINLSNMYMDDKDVRILVMALIKSYNFVNVIETLDLSNNCINKEGKKDIDYCMTNKIIGNVKCFQHVVDRSGMNDYFEENASKQDNSFDNQCKGSQEDNSSSSQKAFVSSRLGSSLTTNTPEMQDFGLGSNYSIVNFSSVISTYSQAQYSSSSSETQERNGSSASTNPEAECSGHSSR